ncbi:FAD-binding oxidoreductase [Roseomonas eburnea]|uniref:FAD-binding oxidoreductase n=1 Tax=Neoroseomonas eburnea TaxID=1346889 RepID=A0A9X9XGI2_9PROT|nr:FAD-binding oxidoreductase [Neoroseomonas eburnea]MBR0682818.1 FAD-binding oxidoreductase [Neoroseomonas eburnea]
MVLPVESVASDADLPEKVDVVVIGGGIIGVSAAFNLAKKGYSVALLEKGKVGAEQSSRNWGWCRVQGRSLPEVPLARFSLSCWNDMERDVGRDVGFRRTGLLVVTDDPKELAELEEWVERAQPYQLDSRMLSPAELRAMLPDAAGSWLGGLYSASDGRAEPLKAAPAIAEAARRMGVTIHQGCAARGMETTGGKVSAVVTERGRIRTSAVLCAGGAWASMFCRRHGISLPQAGVFATACRTEPAPEVMPGGISTGGYAFRRRDDGGYTVAIAGAGRVELTPQNIRYAWKLMPLYRKRRKKVRITIGPSFFRGPEASGSWSFNEVSPFEKIRIFDPPANMDLINKAMARFRADYPVLADIKVAEAWGGFIDSTPDARPVISAVDKLPGFFVAAGFSGHGFGLGPGAGRLAADLVSGDAPIVDPHAYRYSRFTDGTKLRPSSWV